MLIAITTRTKRIQHPLTAWMTDVLHHQWRSLFYATSLLAEMLRAANRVHARNSDISADNIRRRTYPLSSYERRGEETKDIQGM